MFALIVGMFLEFIRHTLGVNAGGHEVMVHIAEHTDDLRGQGFIQNFNGFIYIAFVAFSYGAIFHFVNGALAYLLYISYKVWHKFLVGGRIIGSNRDKIAATQNRMSHACGLESPGKSWMTRTPSQRALKPVLLRFSRQKIKAHHQQR